MKKSLLVVTGMLLFCSAQVNGQSLGQTLLNGFLKGLSSGAQQAQRQAQQRLQQQSNSNSFSLSNTHAENVNKEVKYNDGRRFYGLLKDGRPYQGTMSYPDGTYCEGTFDAYGRKDGLCYVKFSNQTWYYGYYSAGEKDGEGSFCDTSKNYYNMVCRMDEIVSAEQVASPKYKPLEDDPAAYAAFQEEMRRQEAQYAAPTSSGSSSYSRSSSSSSSSSSCGVCHGTGKCNTCNGRGYYTSIGIGSGTHACSSCNRTGRCSSCNGTGRR